MRANEMQVGGSHYRKSDSVQHWDVVDRNGIGYLEGVASKYVCRWREKNGLQDLRKAEHYVIKLLEEVDEHGRRPRGTPTLRELTGLRDAHGLTAVEFGFVSLILSWSCRAHLEAALQDVRELIMSAEASQSSNAAVS